LQFEARIDTIISKRFFQAGKEIANGFVDESCGVGSSKYPSFLFDRKTKLFVGFMQPPKGSLELVSCDCHVRLRPFLSPLLEKPGAKFVKPRAWLFFCVLVYNGNMKERLIRFLIIGVVALLTVGGIKFIADQKQKNPEAVSFSAEPIKKKLEDVGEKILGETVKHLPKSPDLGKVAGSQTQEDDSSQDGQEVEPIQEPINNVQNQTEKLIEIIKELPQDQINAIKKQIFKDLCEELKCEDFYKE